MPLNIIRAWKDRDYRNSLDEEQLAMLPENPAGSIDLTDITEGELAYMQGAGLTESGCPDLPPPQPGTTYCFTDPEFCDQTATCNCTNNRACQGDENNAVVNGAAFGAGVVGGAVIWDAVTAGTWMVVTVTV